MVVAEVDLGGVPVQMLAAEMLVRADHPALEDAENAFDCVR
jgi:hypothetical protein